MNYDSSLIFLNHYNVKTKAIQNRWWAKNWLVGHSLSTLALKIPIKYKYSEKMALNQCLLVIMKSRSLHFSKVTD